MHEDDILENQYLEMIRHNETVSFGKVNFLLVAQSVFILAFATVTGKVGAYFLPELIIAIGLTLSIIWLRWGSTSYKKTGELLRLARNHIRQKDECQKTPSSLHLYFTWRNRCSLGGTSLVANSIFMKGVPWGFITFWSILLLYKFLPSIILGYYILNYG